MKLDSAAFVADPELLRALKSHSIPLDCPRDLVLFNQGDRASGLYIVHAGEVTISMKSVSGELLLSMPAAAGSLLGLPGVLSSQSYTLSAVARRGADVTFISQSDFSRLMLKDPALSMLVLRVLAAEVRTARQAVSSL